jgi:hypothetical protein
VGFPNGKPVLNFDAADRQMRVVRDLGFLAVSSYSAGGVTDLEGFERDQGRVKAAGYGDSRAAIQAIYMEVQQHAQEKGWPLVYWNLCDEPTGDDLKRAGERAAVFRAAFPKGPPIFTGATSLHEQDEGGLYFTLAAALHVPALTTFYEGGVKRLLERGNAWAFYNGGSRWTFGEFLYKAAKEFNLQYRLAWHWNAVAGDPYYALDSREDDYAWANATPDGQLVLSVEFLRISAGLTDYRYLLTLARLAKNKPGTPAAQAAEQLIARRMAAFHLGDRKREESFGPGDWKALRQQIGSAIEALQ